MCVGYLSDSPCEFFLELLEYLASMVEQGGLARPGHPGKPAQPVWARVWHQEPRHVLQGAGVYMATSPSAPGTSSVHSLFVCFVIVDVVLFCFCLLLLFPLGGGGLS